MIKLSECGFTPEEMYLIRECIKIFNASEVTVYERKRSGERDKETLGAVGELLPTAGAMVGTAPNIQG